MITEGYFHITMMEETKISIKESSQKEKQIVVEALSLKPSLLLPSKLKFMSHSLPNSVNSSPLFTSNLMKRKTKGGFGESPCQAINKTVLKHHLLQEIHLRKSKSYGEGGRTSAAFDEFGIRFAKPNVEEHGSIHPEISGGNPKCTDLETNEDEGFKCSALCLYLPGFGKTKPMKTKKEGSERKLGVMISRTVSLEKFECDSWASSKLLNEIDFERDPSNSYFDLPMELIKCSTNDVHTPVTSAFVFEKEVKGILKNGSSRESARKSGTSPNHARFSISYTSHPPSPVSCNAPRSRKVRAREDSNAYLEAQSARGWLNNSNGR